MSVRFFFQLILVTRKLKIEVRFNEFIDLKWWICIFNKIGFNKIGFNVTMKGAPFVTNFNDLSR